MRLLKRPSARAIALAVVAVAAVFCARAETATGDQTASAPFTPLFDGQTLTQWRGDPVYWSVRDGAITGGSTSEIPANTFLIHEGNFRNFELQFKYRFPVPGNSGLNFRSRPDPEQPFEVTGYQANIVTVPPSTMERYANLHEHNGSRPTLAALGEQTTIRRTAGAVSREVVRIVTPPERVLAADKAYPEWNHQVVIVYENRLINAVNGMISADVTDNDELGRWFDGFLALQVHRGPPMEVQFKDLEIRPLTSLPDLNVRFSNAPAPVSVPSAVDTSSSDPLARGRELYDLRCAMCHSIPRPIAPPKATLEWLPPEVIVDALVDGVMKPNAKGISKSDIDAIALFLTSVQRK